MTGNGVVRKDMHCLVQPSEHRLAAQTRQVACRCNAVFSYDEKACIQAIATPKFGVFATFERDVPRVKWLGTVSRLVRIPIAFAVNITRQLREPPRSFTMIKVMTL
jgi:hypothetical protein